MAAQTSKTDKWPEWRHMQGREPAGYLRDHAEQSNCVAGLRTAFEMDHVAAGLVTAYVFIIRFMQAAFSGGVGGSQADGHLLNQCPTAEVVLDVLVLVGFTVFFFVRHYRTAKTGLARSTLVFFLYLGLSYNQPMSCAAKDAEGYKGFRIAVGVLLLLFLGIPALVAHCPSPGEPRYHDDETGSTLQRSVTTSSVMNHSDLLLVVVYNSIIKFTESVDPKTCSKASLDVAIAAAVLIPILFFLKHFVRCRHEEGAEGERDCCSCHFNGVKSCSFIRNSLIRTCLFTVHLLSANPHPLSCGRSPATVAYAQSGLSAVLTLVAMATHPVHSVSSVSD